MRKGFYREALNHCPSCGQNRIVAYTTNGKPLYFVTNEDMTTDEVMNRINSATIGDMVCGACGGHFLCDFSLGFPRAISKSGLRMAFFDNYLNKNK